MSEINPITGLPMEDAQETNTKEEKIGKKEINIIKTEIAALEFEKARRQRSFSGRNPQLGPMIKCPVCTRRHRDNETCLVKYATNSEGEQQIAEPKRFHLSGNPFGWREKHGRFVWFNTLKKFIKLP